jgi:hypothetical protein
MDCVSAAQPLGKDLRTTLYVRSKHGRTTISSSSEAAPGRTSGAAVCFLLPAAMVQAPGTSHTPPPPITDLPSSNSMRAP